MPRCSVRFHFCQNAKHRDLVILNDWLLDQETAES